MAKKFPEFLDDVEVISKLGDNPGSDDDLTADQLKAKFDEAPVAIKAYLIKLVETLENLFSDSGGAISGGNMTGTLNMNQFPLTGLKSPSSGSDATSKKYVDDSLLTSITESERKVGQEITKIKGKLDDFEPKKIVATGINVPAESFEADTAFDDFPYRASVPVSGVSAAMIPEVVFSIAALDVNNLAPVAECYDGGVYVYADKTPTTAVRIETIVCWKGENK